MKASLKSIKQFVSELIQSSNGILSYVGSPTSGFHGRKKEVEAVKESLLKQRMRNCILVGPAGVGKTEIVKKAIKETGIKEIFLSLDVGFMQSGCTLVGQFEQRMKNIVEPIADYNSQSDTKISLFIDEIHALWNVNRNLYAGTVSAADMLKPYLSSGKITIIGATTYDEYKEHVMKDKALLRRLPPIFVNGMDDECVVAILKKFVDNQVSEDLCRKIVEQSKKVVYLSNPDCSLEIADRVMARSLAHGRLASSADVDEVISLMVAIDS